MTTPITLDQLDPDAPARISGVAWDRLAPDEAKRLRALGLDEGAEIIIAQRGMFFARDPIALIVGRSTIVIRRAHAAAMQVEVL